MAWIGTGPGGSGHTATLTKRISVDPEAFDGDTVRLRFWYKYVSEEYLEFVGSIYNDVFSADVRTPSGVIPVVMESVNATNWTPISGIDFPSGDSTTGQSGWIRASVDIPLASLGGESTIELVVYDVGDSVHDSVALS